MAKKLTKLASLLVALMMVFTMAVSFVGCEQPTPKPPVSSGSTTDSSVQEHDCAVDGHVDADKDGVCDVCGSQLIEDSGNVGLVDDLEYHDPATCAHTDEDGNCVCDVCKTSLGHKDENKDGYCDVCKNKFRDNQEHIFKDAVVTNAVYWNNHDYQTSDDSYPLDFINVGLYEFFFTGDKKGYEIWPMMAAAYPEDVTAEVKKDAYWGTVIPADAADSYAYKIRLNQNAKWADGTVINADTYVQSFELLMNPDRKNYRANDQMSGNMVIAGCANYYYSKSPQIFKSVSELGYESNDEAIEAGVELYIDVWNIWNAEGYTDAEGNECPQWLNINDTHEYNNEKGNDPTSGAIVYDYCVEEGGYIDVGDPYDAYVASIVNNENIGWTFDKVGMFKTGEYEFTIVLQKPCKGFYLLYSLASNWIVEVDKYVAWTETDPITGEIRTTYNTSVETSCGYGPYKLTKYDATTMEYERDLNWWGYQDDRFDCFYHTSKVETRVVKEASTRKEMFLAGDLMGYGLQQEDYAQYGNSEYLYKSPGTTVFFLLLSCNEQALLAAQSGKENVNKTILLQESFREALSVCFNKADFCATVSPARSPAYSVIGAYDIWNPTTGEKYRATPEAKKGLVEYYGFEAHKEVIAGYEVEYYSVPGSDSKYTLDQAVAAVTGFNADLAKAKFLEAYEAELAAGRIDEDDVIEIEYSISAPSKFMNTTIDYLNDQINAVLEGTVLYNRVKITQSAPKGTKWSDDLKAGVAQTCLCGWQGGALDPFNTMLYYLEPGHDPYAKGYWKTETINATIELPVGENGETVALTMKLDNWAKCLTGDPITVGGKTYNFGYRQCDDSIRLTIMAELEKVILGSLYYIPMMQDGGASLLSQKISYALGRDDYNAVMGRGGMTYLTYNYSEAEWEAVKGSLKY